jgi:peptidoglycan/xylan/chitin deacetylase (PgdA/CDA1 family)
MYHYVRDGARVHARTSEEFERQLDYIEANYTVVGCEAASARRLPEDACLLSFDDGLREHLEVVAPALEARGFRGVFCPPAKPVLERAVLDVQKTQFLLAHAEDHAALGEQIVELARVEDEARFRAENTPPHRFDPPETVFVKRSLQDGLPEERRQPILDRLFAEHVTADERAFADELYLTLAECRELVQRGHDVIGHGYEHRRLALLEEAAQRAEIERTREFVELVGGLWAFCYPYGSRNEGTLRLLAESGCVLGLTTDVGVAGPDADLLQLPRLDTNDLPVGGEPRFPPVPPPSQSARSDNP